jgi:hypothetical protein
MQTQLERAPGVDEISTQKVYLATPILGHWQERKRLGKVLQVQESLEFFKAPVAAIFDPDSVSFIQDILCIQLDNFFVKCDQEPDTCCVGRAVQVGDPARKDGVWSDNSLVYEHVVGDVGNGEEQDKPMLVKGVLHSLHIREH